MFNKIFNFLFEKKKDKPIINVTPQSNNFKKRLCNVQLREYTSLSIYFIGLKGLK